MQSHIFGVPTTIANGIVAEGPLPEETLLELVLHAADPSHPPPRLLSLPFRGCGRLEPRAEGLWAPGLGGAS